MSWLVDTCVLLDILDADSAFGPASARLIDHLAPEGLEISPVSSVEIAPSFLGDSDRQELFLREIGVSISSNWDIEARRAAEAAWTEHVIARRKGLAPKRPIADVLIGALALRHDGLVTRNGADFRRFYPSLRIVDPSAQPPPP